MAKIHPGATLTPHFRDFLPGWVARQPWFLAEGVKVLHPVGYFRFEDPAGEVGIETHLVTHGSQLYQIPMTYRTAPIASDVSAATPALITRAVHSVLGTRWIYDAETDPVWISQVLRLVQANAVTEPGGRLGVGRTEARGQLLTSTQLTAETVSIELRRRVTTGDVPSGPGIIGLVMGGWELE